MYTTVWDPYQKYNGDKIERVQRRAARFVKSRYSRYSSVSDMFYVLGCLNLLPAVRIEPSTCTLEVAKSGALTYYAMGAMCAISVHPFRIIP